MRTVILKAGSGALAGIVQWTECSPMNQSVTGLIPTQDTCPACGPGPQ